jgi:hypothetical protein
VCAETNAEPSCVGCQRDSDCNDGIECTLERCTDSECERVTLPLGNSCGGGVCTGLADEDSCVRCVDDASAGVDTGCTPALPRCDTSTNPATCSGCALPAQCDDDNACTTDGCREGVCEHATLASGTPCPHGYCNGIPGVELCVPKPCQTDVDCDDRVACTAEVCESNSCAYTADHGQCVDSGDVCRPNLCTVGSGCREIDLSRSLELLSNGYLDSGNVDWVETSMSYGQVIYPFDYVPTLLPHTELYIAWLGGGEGLMDEANSLAQTVSIPTGAVRLELSFFYQIWTEELPDNHNHLAVTLRSTESNQSDEEVVTFYNQDKTRIWTGFRSTIDAGDWAGSDAILNFNGTGIDGFTHFFVDSISLVATVCE